MSYLEEVLAAQIAQSDLPQPVREFRFAPPRRWRFDFAWVEQRLAVEVEGGVHTGGRHTRPVGFRQDCEKYNQAVLEGWRVLRFESGSVESGAALEIIEKALSDGGRDANNPEP